MRDNPRASAAFALDWITSFSPTVLGFFIALTVIGLSIAFIISFIIYARAKTEPESGGFRKAMKLSLEVWQSKRLHRLIQMTCNCPCYTARPKLRFLVRIGYLFICFVIRIICISLYASSENGTDGGSLLAVLCAMSLVFLSHMFLMDLYHYSVWWYYRPQLDTTCSFHSRKHKRFIPYHLLGRHRTFQIGNKPCHESISCPNRSLEHIFVFHGRDFKPQPRYSQIIQLSEERNIYIGFHQTDPEAAISISHSDFRLSTNERTTMLGHGIYFARSIKGTSRKANARGAYICAEIEMGKVKTIRIDEIDSVRGSRDWWAEYDTVYYEHDDEELDEFCVKSENQVLRWVMVIEKDFDPKVERYGLNGEFSDTACKCI